MKNTLNPKDHCNGKKSNGLILASQAHGGPFIHHHHPHSYHHGTCQRYPKPKRITTPVVNESMSMKSFIVSNHFSLFN